MFWRFTIPVLVLSIAASASAGDIPRDDLLAFFGAATAPAPAVKKLTNEQKAEIDRQRVCIRSYPWGWPDLNAIAEEHARARGDEQEELARRWVSTFNKHFQALTAADMKKIRYEVNEALSHVDLNVVRFRLGRYYILGGQYEDVPREERERYGDALMPGPVIAWFGTATPVELAVTKRIANGGDPKQMRLFGDFLYARLLYREGAYGPLLDLVAEARRRGGVAPAAVSWDEAEVATNYSVGTLGNLLCNFGYAAKAAGAFTGLEEAPRFATEFLDARPLLERSMGYSVDPAPAVLRAVASTGPAERFQPDAPQWRVMQDLRDAYPTVAGLFWDGPTLTLYLKGASMHTFALEGDQVRLVRSEDAAAGFEARCRAQIKAFSTDRMRLFHVGSYGGPMYVTFADGTEIRLTDDEADRLRRGERLADDHPFTTRVAADSGKSWVLYADPLMLRLGPQLSAAEGLLAGTSGPTPSCRWRRTHSQSRPPAGRRRSGRRPWTGRMMCSWWWAARR